jgi:hypothetical protein
MEYGFSVNAYIELGGAVTISRTTLSMITLMAQAAFAELQH